nr:quiescin-sulfhydryl oxidase 2 [Tanacetum cinerariifolium]
AVGSVSHLNYSGYQQPDLVVELDVTNFSSVLKDSTANHTIIEFLCSLVSSLQKPEFEKVARLFNGAAATYPDTVLVTRVDCAIKAVGSVSLLNYSGHQQPDLVVELDVTNFSSVLKDSTANHTIIEFYAHWSPACRRYKPEFEKVARLFNGAAATYPDTVLVTRVDCAIKANTNICDKFSVTHYPMLFWGTPSGFAAGSIDGSTGKSEIRTINDGRTAHRMLKWINTRLGRISSGFVVRVQVFSSSLGGGMARNRGGQKSAWLLEIRSDLSSPRVKRTSSRNSVWLVFRNGVGEEVWGFNSLLVVKLGGELSSVIFEHLAKNGEKDTNTLYLKNLKNSRPLPDFEEYVVSTSVDTSCMILWSNIKKNTFLANTPYPKLQYSVSEEPILRIQRTNTPYWSILHIRRPNTLYWSICRIQKSDMAYPNQLKKIMEYFIRGAHEKSSNASIIRTKLMPVSQDENPPLRTIFGFPPYPFNYPTRRLTIEEMLAKFINEGVIIRGGNITSEVTRSKKINKYGINKNEPSRFEQDVQEKPHNDGEKNKSSSIRERTTQPLVKPQQSSIPFPNWVGKEKEEALQRIFLENLKQLDINISFIEALVQIPKYAKYLKSLLTNKSSVRGKENGVNILQSIDNGPYQMGTTRDTLGTADDGGLPKDIYKLIKHNTEAKAIWDNVKMLLAGSELTKKDSESQLYDEFERFKMIPRENITDYYVRFHKLVNDMRNIKMMMPKIQLNSKFDGRVVIYNVQGRQNQNQRNFARGTGVVGNGNAQNRAGNANQGQGKPIKCYNYGGFRHITRNCTQPKRPQNSDYFKEKMLLMQAQENGVVLDEQELSFLAGKQANTYDADVDDQPVHDMAQNDPNILQTGDYDDFDSDVDDEPTAQTIFMANLSSLQQAGPYNASILSEVLNLENAIEHHEIPNEVQPKNVLDSDSADMGNSNVIPYEQYMNHNEESVVPSGASSVQYDDYMLHENSAYIPDDSFTTTLKFYKDQVAIYKQRTKFELTDREQKMDDQIRMLIQERNFREEKLKKELHSLQLQFNHTIHHKKIMQDSVNTLQHDFKQKEMKLLNDYSRLKTLKNKYAQDQSIQTVYMMLKPKTMCDEHREKDIVDPNSFHLKKAKMVQPTLYDGDEIFKSYHIPVTVHDSEETLEIAETTRKKMSEKMHDPESVAKRVKIIPSNYSKENFLATFSPQTQLTPEQGVQKTLITKVKEMKEIFKSMEAEVDQNATDLSSGEIERKNLLITNEDLIAKCIAHDVFYIVSNSALTASQFHELSIAYNVAKTRADDLEAENLNLHKKFKMMIMIT